MKKTFVAGFCAVGFLLLAGGVIVEDRPNPVMINGRPFANAITINGVLAISVEDLAMAVGGTRDPRQAGFQLVGTTLTTSPRDPASGLPTGKRMHKPFVITKQADVSSAILMKNGKAYVPLADVVRAFGGAFVLNPRTVRPGDPISLNFAVNANAALAVGE
jgi:hypothetical protein